MEFVSDWQSATWGNHHLSTGKGWGSGYSNPQQKLQGDASRYRHDDKSMTCMFLFFCLQHINHHKHDWNHRVSGHVAVSINGQVAAKVDGKGSYHQVHI